MNQEAERHRLRKEFDVYPTDSVFMDNAGGSLVPRLVTKAMHKHLTELSVQPGQHKEGEAVNAIIKEGKGLVETMLNSEEGGCSIGSSSRALVASATRAMMQMKQRPQFVICNNNHQTHLTPFIDVNPSEVTMIECVSPSLPGFFNPDDLLSALRSLDNTKPTVVVVAQVSNLLGETIDVKKICNICRSFPRTYSFVDGVAFASSSHIDIQRFLPDFYTLSLYKMLCPQSAVLYASPRGWDFLNVDRTVFEYGSGGTNWAVYSGIIGMAKYLERVVFPMVCRTKRELIVEGYSKMYELVRPLVVKMRRYIVDHPNATLLASSQWEKCYKPIVSFIPKGVTPAHVVEFLNSRGVVCKSGNMMAPLIASDLGLSDAHGAVRISLAHYNTEEEVDRVIGLLDIVLDCGSSKL
eukprot:TRINITY_DN1717_c1_g3_i1.p1 TRINITY_DN1717_c1_g3~~TRINITY_DN1717_c1_g3_i1.p1  ORF type:complete len:409 (+),score=55.29 TRINITY_DN1717_c1_g3_i1:70-1296(+)